MSPEQCGIAVSELERVYPYLPDLVEQAREYVADGGSMLDFVTKIVAKDDELLALWQEYTGLRFIAGDPVIPWREQS